MLRLPLIRYTFAPMLLGLIIACGGGDGDDNSEPTPAPTEVSSGTGAPEQALAQHVEATMQRPFVPDCAQADIATDTNKICAAFRGERDNQRAYVLGPTFSEFSQWAILEDRNGQWAVAATYPVTPDTQAVKGIPWPLRTGVDVVVADNQCVNVRVGPALNQAAVDCINPDTVIRLNAGPITADGYNWWQVEGRSGWVAGEFLRYPDAAQ